MCKVAGQSLNIASRRIVKHKVAHLSKFTHLLHCNKVHHHVFAPFDLLKCVRRHQVREYRTQNKLQINSKRVTVPGLLRFKVRAPAANPYDANEVVSDDHQQKDHIQCKHLWKAGSVSSRSEGDYAKLKKV